MIKECEAKAASFVGSQYSKSQNSSSKIQDMLFIKPRGHSNKRTKSFYESNVPKKAKLLFDNVAELRIIDVTPYKSKGRPSTKTNANKHTSTDRCEDK